MTDTVISSASKEVIIGSNRPFVMIGERINPTGRKMLAKEMAEGDFSRVEQDTLAQVAAGAQMLDVNAGIPLADEPQILADTIKLVQSLTNVPLSIDSSIVAALEAGLEVYQGKALLNSVTGEEERLEVVLPLVKNTVAQWSQFPMMKQEFPKTRMCVLQWQKKLLNMPRIMEFPVQTLLLTLWLCRSEPSIPR
jgi:cobalamin-dependent methionine synthase I